MVDQSKFPVSDVLAVSCAIHRQLGGFLSKTESMILQLHNDPAYQPANSDLLYQHFYGDTQVEVTDADRVQAQQVSDYIKGLAFKTFQRQLSDYEKNMLLMVNATAVSASQLGVSAGMPKMYSENFRAENWNQREAQLAPVSEFMGKLGDSLSITGVLEYWKVIPRTHSTFMIVSVDQKHILKFYWSGRIPTQLISASEIQLHGSVKAHTLSDVSGARITQLRSVSLSR